MKKNQKIFSILLVIAMMVGVVALSGCTQTQTSNKIIVGTSTDFPPFEVKLLNGTVVGFDVEMITKILTSQNYTVEIQDIDFDSLTTELNAKKIDVIVAGLSITEERKQVVNFSDPYYRADQSALVLNSSGIIINNVSNFSGYIVGAQTATTGADWVQANLVDTNIIPSSNFKQYQNQLDAITDLKTNNSGRPQILVLDKPVARNFSTQDPTLKIAHTFTTNEYYGIAVRKTDTTLLEKINQGLAELQASPEWTLLLQKYQLE
jgi:polar amino acid transport system substrate-binding protein